jgi:predicted TIM-barrel fold metal-dependent hydrolase
MLIGDSGPCLDMDAALAELLWIKEHGFFGIMLPGFLGYPESPPLYDERFEQYWAACEDLEMPLAIHAAYGMEQGSLYPEIQKLAAEMAVGSSVLEEMVSNAEESFFAFDLRPRKALWQLMLGGVFDRHPKLKVLVTEVRVDWVPGTLARLDEWFEFADVPAQKRPSEYWHENCIAGASFMKRSEIDMRHEVGVDRVMFGRDYPHAESTWPKTREYLQTLLDGVPEAEARLMLGENAINFLGLDRVKLAKMAERINAPSPADLLGHGQNVDNRYIRAFDARSGYLKPPENVDIGKIDELVRADFFPSGLTS